VAFAVPARDELSNGRGGLQEIFVCGTAKAWGNREEKCIKTLSTHGAKVA